jgi:hypothetical protein
MPHKPAGQGFLFYTICSHGGILHDFIASGSQSHLEIGQDGLVFDVATYTTRKRKRGTGSTTGQSITLAPTRALVYILCERITSEYRGTPFACYTDNLFTSLPLAKALRSIHIGLCGTARTNSAGIPSILTKIKKDFSGMMTDNQVIVAILDDIVNCTLWKDSLRGNIVLMLSTMHRPANTRSVLRRCNAGITTRSRDIPYQLVQVDQPAIAVDYNKYMGNCDTFNHLIQSRSILRPGQRRWTTIILGFILNTCLTNAWIVYRDYHTERCTTAPIRNQFTSELLEQLIKVYENVHLPSLREKRSFCQWTGCYTGPKAANRMILGEVAGNARQHSSQTNNYCNDCRVVLCLRKGCWARYHDSKQLDIRPQDRYPTGGGG